MHPVIASFVEDANSKDRDRLGRWMWSRGLDLGLDILTDSERTISTTIFSPVISDDQLAATFIVWNDRARAYEHIAVFFAKVEDRWRLYGLFTDSTFQKNPSAVEADERETSQLQREPDSEDGDE